MHDTRRLGLWFGLVIFAAILLLTDLHPGEPQVTRMAAVAALMAIWWITEALPLAVTALVPLVAFPLFGILKGRETAPIYVNNVIFLFIGGFLIAIAMERCGLHKRIALRIIMLIGGSPSRLVLGFMVASAFLSMWISNTATSIMMLAIGLAIIEENERAFGVERTHALTLSLLLGIAYGATIGGIATLVGTPPNLSFVRIFEQTFPNAEPIAFGQWMLLGLPLSGVMLLIVWLLLTRVFFRVPKDLALPPNVIQGEFRALGRLRFAEKVVFTVFSLTALLWVFRKDLVLGAWSLPGWGGLLPHPGMIDDGTVAIAMALVLFAIPSRESAVDGKRQMILEAQSIARLPWHVVLLFGGGFALARGFQVSGLSAFIGERFASLAGASPYLMVAVVCGSITFLTELTSNTATTEMILPILASISVAMKMNPLLLMVPAALSASCAFMLPVATPPNAIIFGSGRVRIPEMARVGIVINLIGMVVITLLFMVIGRLVFGIELDVLPEWAVIAPGH